MFCPEYQIRQSVEVFEKRRLSASGRTKDGKYLLRENLQINIPKGLKGLIIEIEILDDYLVLSRHKFPLSPMADIPIE